MDSTVPGALDGLHRSIDEAPALIGKFFVAGRLDGTARTERFHAAHPVMGESVEIVLALDRVEATDRDAVLTLGRSLAELRHPRIPRVLDMDFDDGRPYLVSEYRRGTPIDALDPRAYPGQYAAWLADIADAIGEAGSRGLSHGDIGPGSVLIDEEGDPVLVGWGAILGMGQPDGPSDVAALGGMLRGLLGDDAPAALLGECDHATAEDPAARPGACDWARAVRRAGKGWWPWR